MAFWNLAQRQQLQQLEDSQLLRDQLTENPSSWQQQLGLQLDFDPYSLAPPKSAVINWRYDPRQRVDTAIGNFFTDPNAENLYLSPLRQLATASGLSPRAADAAAVKWLATLNMPTSTEQGFWDTYSGIGQNMLGDQWGQYAASPQGQSKKQELEQIGKYIAQSNASKKSSFLLPLAMMLPAIGGIAAGAMAGAFTPGAAAAGTGAAEAASGWLPAGLQSSGAMTFPLESAGSIFGTELAALPAGTSLADIMAFDAAQMGLTGAGGTVLGPGSAGPPSWAAGETYPVTFGPETAAGLQPSGATTFAAPGVGSVTGIPLSATGIGANAPAAASDSYFTDMAPGQGYGEFFGDQTTWWDNIAAQFPDLGLPPTGAPGGGGTEGGDGMLSTLRQWAPLLGAAGSIYSGIAGSSAAKDAADQMVLANLLAQQSTDARLKPWLESGAWALGNLKDLMSSPVNELLLDPSYNWRLGEGVKAINKSQAAKGALKSGATLKRLLEYGQGVGSQEYQNIFNRYASLAGLSQPLTSTSATTNALLQQGSGQAQAAGTIGSQQQINDAISQMLQLIQSQTSMNRIFGMPNSYGV